VSTFDDNQDMRAQNDERLLAGQVVPGEPELVDLVAALRRTVDVPAPRPTPALSAMLRDGLVAPVAVEAARGTASTGTASSGTAPTGTAPTGTASVRVRRRLRTAWRFVAGLGLAGKIALGAGVAFAGVTGAATIGAVPAAIQVPARAVVDGVAHLFAPGANAPVHPVTTSSPTATSDRGTPGPSPSDGSSTPGRHEPTSRPTHPDPVSSTGADKRSAEGTGPTGDGSTPPSSNRAAEPTLPEVAATHGPPGVAASPTLPPTARTGDEPARPWESSAEHVNSHG